MAKKRLQQLLDGITMSFTGPTDFADGYALPLVQGIGEGVRKAGLARALDEPILPPHAKRLRTHVKMDAAITTAIIGLAVFLGSSLGSWAVSRVCDELWDNRIRPVLSRFRRSKLKRSATPFWLEFSVYYAHDDVTVTVRALVASNRDLLAAERLVPAAERKALAFLAANGIDCRELIYTLRDRQLSEAPRKR